jgi:hypothetical protein
MQIFAKGLYPVHFAGCVAEMSIGWVNLLTAQGNETRGYEGSWVQAIERVGLREEE